MLIPTAILLLVSASPAEDSPLPHDYPIQPVPFTQVHAADEFWQPRMETNRTVSIPYAFGKCEENGRMDNFKIAAGLIAARHRGDFPFDDTDPYKIAEGAAWTLLYRDGDQWRPVANPSEFGCEADRYNRTTFDPVTTDALRIEVQLAERFAAGIHEWRVE